MSALLHWHWMRWVRLFAAVAFLMQGLMASEPFALWAGAFFGIQAIFNTGCCAAGTCAAPPTRAATSPDGPTFQEVTPRGE